MGSRSKCHHQNTACLSCRRSMIMLVLQSTLLLWFVRSQLDFVVVSLRAHGWLWYLEHTVSRRGSLSTHAEFRLAALKKNTIIWIFINYLKTCSKPWVTVSCTVRLAGEGFSLFLFYGFSVAVTFVWLCNRYPALSNFVSRYALRKSSSISIRSA